jgi:hypothetical protein
MIVTMGSPDIDVIMLIRVPIWLGMLGMVGFKFVREEVQRCPSAGFYS